MTILAILAIGAIVCHLLIFYLIRRFDLRKPNFKEQKIPSVAGLYIVSYGVFGTAAARYLPIESDYSARLYLVAILGFGLLGLVDDLFGSRGVGGFRGHFKVLYLEKRLTTGAAKAVGGGLLALYLGYRTSHGALWLWALDAAVIALAANTINLLDLRPGRAIFVFFFGLTAALLLGWGTSQDLVPIAAVAISAAVVAMYDSLGKAMLGDVGSNTLGAVLGLTLVLQAGIGGEIAAAIIFLAINIYSERRSISELIERHPALRWMDSKLGVR